MKMSRRVVAILGLAGGMPATAFGQYTRVLELNEVSGRSEYEFGAVAGLDRTSTGEILVLDRLRHEIRVFSPEGSLLRRFGREGSGPGEFLLPSRFELRGREVLVFDPRLQRIVRFDISGRHLGTEQTPQGGGLTNIAVPMRHGFWLGLKINSIDSSRIQRIAASSGSASDRLLQEYRLESGPTLFAFRAEGTARVDTLFRYDSGSAFYFGRPAGLPLGFLREGWRSSGDWSTSGDSLVAFVNGVEGIVQVMRVQEDGFETIRSGRVSVETRAVTPAEVSALVERQRRDGLEVPPNVEISAPAFHPQLGRIVFSDDGALWIERIAGGSGSPRYLILPTDGSPQRHVELPPGFILEAVRGEYLLGVRKNAFDAETVELWRPD